jgi:hypothetical protein
MIKKQKEIQKLPFVSICTPTFNRRPFFPVIIECFRNQTYPSDRMEWIIIDDGKDKIEDLVKGIPQVKYFKYDKKMTLGKKRNLMHDKAKGDILVYMDDDDYYPPERVSHAVETLQNNPSAMCAGSSEMYIYFKDLKKMYKFGPYGPNHSTAATFAFRRELLKTSRYDENACLAEEKSFLKNYTVPFVQLNPLKTILVFSHIHNSFDKKILLNDPNPFVNLSEKGVDDFVKEANIKQFFCEKIDELLQNYDLGKIEYKPDVIKQTEEIQKNREKIMEAAKIMGQNQGMMDINSIMVNTPMGQMNLPTFIAGFEQKLAEQSNFIQEILRENGKLREKTQYLEDKMKTLITERIQEKKALMLAKEI